MLCGIVFACRIPRGNFQQRMEAGIAGIVNTLINSCTRVKNRASKAYWGNARNLAPCFVTTVFIENVFVAHTPFPDYFRRLKEILELIIQFHIRKDSKVMWYYNIIILWLNKLFQASWDEGWRFIVCRNDVTMVVRLRIGRFVERKLLMDNYDVKYICNKINYDIWRMNLILIFDHISFL